MNTISYNFGIATLSRLIVGGISLVIIGFLTRYLGPAGFGNYSLVLAYLYIFTALADLGLGTILVREISKKGADEGSISSNIFTLRLFATVLFLAVGIILAVFLSYPVEVKIGIALASLFSFFSSQNQVMVGVFQKHLRLYYISLADVAARCLQLALVLILARSHPSFVGFVGAIVISELLRFGVIYSFSRRITGIKLKFDLNYWSQTLRKSLPIAISLVFVLLYFKMDTVLLSLMKPAHDVGVYSVAYKILETGIFLPALYIGLMMPVLSRHAFGDRSEFIKAYRKSFDILAIFAIPVLAFIFLRAYDIINIIGGHEYGASVGVLKVLSLAIALIFFGNLGGNALVALDLQKKGIWIYLAGAVFNIGANIIFIPRFSYMATAWTTVLTELLITYLLFRLIRKHASASVKLKTALKAGAATMITASLLTWTNLNFVAFTCLSVIYFPVLYLFKGFSLADLKAIISMKPAEGVIE